jgi:hypothetical protein
MQGRSPQPADAGLAAEEAELRARVQQIRLKKLAEETTMARIALTREGAQIRAEISRLRTQIALGASAPGAPGGGASASGGGR